MAEKKTKPRGREEIVTALIEAAAELFSRHGVETVTVRDIASHAGLNHGLIHRHFGSKENLRIKTQEFLAKRVMDEIGEPENFVDAIWRAEQAIKNQPMFWKVMARTFLDDKFDGDIQGSFPLIHKMVEFIRKGQEEELISIDMDPRYIVAAVAAYGLGMRVFEKYIIHGTGLEDVLVEEVLSKIKNHFISMFFPDAADIRSED